MDDSYDQIARIDDYWTMSRSYSSTNREILKSCRLGKEKKGDIFYTETERAGRFQVEVRDWLETEQEEDRNVHIWTYMDHGAWDKESIGVWVINICN